MLSLVNVNVETPPNSGYRTFPSLRNVPLYLFPGLIIILTSVTINTFACSWTWYKWNGSGGSRGCLLTLGNECVRASAGRVRLSLVCPRWHSERNPDIKDTHCESMCWVMGVFETSNGQVWDKAPSPVNWLHLHLLWAWSWESLPWRTFSV